MTAESTILVVPVRFFGFDVYQSRDRPGKRTGEPFGTPHQLILIGCVKDVPAASTRRRWAQSRARREVSRFRRSAPANLINAIA